MKQPEPTSTAGSAGPAVEAIAPSPARLAAERDVGRVARCMQCHKCTAGCPVAETMDLAPSEIVRLVQLGAEAPLLASRAIWICTGCHTCTTRCPGGVDLSHLQDALRRRCLEQGPTPAEPRAAQAHVAALDTIERFGRLNELSFVARYKWASRRWLDDADLGVALLRRGKLGLWPARIRGRREVARVVRRGRPQRGGGEGR